MRFAALTLVGLAQALPSLISISLTSAPVLTHISTSTIHAGTYPRITRLSDTTLLGTVTNFDSGTTRLLSLRSTDDGETWTRIGQIDHAVTADKDLDNAFALQVPDGTVLAAFRNHNKVEGGYSHYRITLCKSPDNGASWEYVTQVWEQANADPATKIGAWEPFMRLNGETVQIYYSQENSGADQDSILHTNDSSSYDEWAPAVTVSGSDVLARDGMIGVAELNGRLYMVFESQPEGHFQVFMSESDDGGASWQNRRVIHNPSCSGKCHSGAPQIITVGDVLVVSFMTDEDGPYGDWPAGGSAKMIASADAGASWSDSITVNGAGSMWPGLFALDEESFLVSYEYKGASTAGRYVIA